jgi:hypothetical protein
VTERELPHADCGSRAAWRGPANVLLACRSVQCLTDGGLVDEAEAAIFWRATSLGVS